jgi:hypothetical protein
MRRRAECLSAIEKAFFMVTATPSNDANDEEDTTEQCLLSWGAKPDSYVLSFQEALKKLARAALETINDRPAFEKWVAGIGGEAANRRWPTAASEMYANVQVQDYREGWSECRKWLLELLNSADSSHSGDPSCALE